MMHGGYLLSIMRVCKNGIKPICSTDYVIITVLCMWEPIVVKICVFPCLCDYNNNMTVTCDYLWKQTVTYMAFVLYRLFYYNNCITLPLLCYCSSHIHRNGLRYHTLNGLLYNYVVSKVCAYINE